MSIAASGPGRARSSIARLALLGVLWGVTFPMVRLGVATGADPFLLLTLSFAIAASVAAGWALLTRTERPPLARLLESAGAGALLIAGINVPLYWGVRFATGGVASVVYACSPMVSVAVAALWGVGGGVGRRGTAALALGLGGVLVLALAAGGSAITSAWGLVAFGVGATCQGAGAVVLARLRPTGEGRWGQTFQFLGGGAATLAVLCVLHPTMALPATPAVALSLAYVGLVSMVAGYALFFDLIRRDGAVGANEVTYLNPVVALAVGVLVFGEPFAPEEVVGLGIILVALLLLNAPRVRVTDREPPPADSPGPAGVDARAPA